MSLNKKVFFISLTLFCVALLLFGVYNLSFKSPKEEAPPTEKKVTEVSEPKITPKISNASIALISDEAVLAPTLIKDTHAIKYYDKNSGRVYQIDFDGNNKRTFSDQELIGLDKVLWSPDKTKVITKFISADKTKFFYYNYTTLKNTRIKDTLSEIVWHNSSNRIFYVYSDPNTKKRTLNISDPEGTNWIKLADIPFSETRIAEIPQSTLVSFWNKPDAFFETTLKSIPLIGGEEKIILKNIFGADYLWSNNGNSALVSHSNAKGGTKIQLSLVNSSGGEFRNLNLPTLVSKCVWLSDNKTVYCALPGEIPASAIMPNDYDQEKFHTADTFWKIDTLTGEKSRIVDLNKITNGYDATNLFLNTDESILFFTNRLDGKLYRITL
jgi:hypothetical protein